MVLVPSCSRSAESLHFHWWMSQYLPTFITFHVPSTCLHSSTGPLDILLVSNGFGSKLFTVPSRLSTNTEQYSSYGMCIYLSTYLPTYLSTYLPIYLSIYLSTYLPMYLSTYLRVDLSTLILSYLILSYLI